jgi:uncharacterized membrane protein (UPF0127 family)
MSDASRRSSHRGLSRFFRAPLLFAVFFLAPPALGAETALERLDIITATGPHVFSVEVARTEDQRETGLMYRRSLPEDGGMLFNFHIEEIVTMWMKNTYIPLDMIFVSRRGAVVSVAENAQPLSERTISSGRPAYAVIEVNAGTARRIGLAAGDKVRHPIFER